MPAGLDIWKSPEYASGPQTGIFIYRKTRMDIYFGFLLNPFSGKILRKTLRIMT